MNTAWSGIAAVSYYLLRSSAKFQAAGDNRQFWPEFSVSGLYL